MELVSNRRKIAKQPKVANVTAGAKRDKPSRPRYDSTWEPDLVLNYWRANPPRSVKELRARAISLLMLSIYCRPSDLARFSIAHCCIRDDELRFRIRGPKEARNDDFLTPEQRLPFMPEGSEEAGFACAGRAVLAYWDSISDYVKDESSGRGIFWSLLRALDGTHPPIGSETISNEMCRVMRAEACPSSSRAVRRGQQVHPLRSQRASTSRR